MEVVSTDNGILELRLEGTLCVHWLTVNPLYPERSCVSSSRAEALIVLVMYSVRNVRTDMQRPVCRF
jgi:hypothetical protein